MTASCAAITAARLASITSSQWAKKLSGRSATPSKDNSSYTTIFRTPRTSDWSRCSMLTDQAAETNRRDVQGVGHAIDAGTLGRGREELAGPAEPGSQPVLGPGAVKAHVGGTGKARGGARAGGKRGLVQAVARGDKQAEFVAADRGGARQGVDFDIPGG